MHIIIKVLLIDMARYFVRKTISSLDTQGLDADRETNVKEALPMLT